MCRLFVFSLCALVSAAGYAQLHPTPRVIQKISDLTMVIDDRGAKLEVIPTSRAVQTMASSGKQIIHSVFPASESAPISPRQLGVVFNHAMQVQGYITGEIALKMKNGTQATEVLDPASYPGLVKLTNPNVYLVVARTPGEFVDLVKRLQGRADMEWVEPVVTYGTVQGVPDAR